METNLANSELIRKISSSPQQESPFGISGHFVTDHCDVIFKVLKSNRKELQAGKKLFLKKSIVNELISKGILKRSEGVVPSSFLEENRSPGIVVKTGPLNETVDQSLGQFQNENSMKSEPIQPNVTNVSEQKRKAAGKIKSKLKFSLSEIRRGRRITMRTRSYSLSKLRSFRKMGKSMKPDQNKSKRKRKRLPVLDKKLINGEVRLQKRKNSVLKKSSVESVKHSALDDSKSEKILNDDLHDNKTEISNKEVRASKEQKLLLENCENKNVNSTILGKRTCQNLLSASQDKNQTPCKKRKMCGVSTDCKRKHETVNCEKCWVLLTRLEDINKFKDNPKEKISKHERILNWIDNTVLPSMQSNEKVNVSVSLSETDKHVTSNGNEELLNVKKDDDECTNGKLKQNSHKMKQNDVRKKSTRFKRSKKIKEPKAKVKLGKNLMESNAAESGLIENSDLISKNDTDVARSTEASDTDQNKNGSFQSSSTILDHENGAALELKTESPTLKKQIQKKLNIFGLQIKDICKYFDVSHFINWKKSNPESLLSIKKLTNATSMTQPKFCFAIVEADKRRLSCS